MNDKATVADLRAALLDPASAFDAPEDVVARDDLSATVRIEILRRWEYDARELEVAEEESIIGHDADDLLDRIHAALDELGATLDLEASPPTKQGGVAASAVAERGDAPDPETVDDATLAAMREALDDEYKARATYRAVIAAFGEVRPFVNIVDAEERHATALSALFDRFGIAPPPDRWAGRIAAPETLAEACATAIAAEIDNAEMYLRLLGEIRHPAVRDVMRNLQAASRDNHLPAFRRCLDRENGGDSKGGGRRRRRRGRS